MAREPERGLTDEEAREVVRLHHARLAEEARLDEVARIAEAEARGVRGGRAHLALSLGLSPEEFEEAVTELARLKATEAWEVREKRIKFSQRIVAAATGGVLLCAMIAIPARGRVVEPPPVPFVQAPEPLWPWEREVFLTFADWTSRLPEGYVLDLSYRGGERSRLPGRGPKRPRAQADRIAADVAGKLRNRILHSNDLTGYFLENGRFGVAVLGPDGTAVEASPGEEW